MRRLLIWAGLTFLVGLAGLVLGSGSGDPQPSTVALAHGYPAGLYSEAEFSISDDAAVMVLSVHHVGRSMRLYGDGRLEIQAAENESYTRRLDHSRMLEIFRAAVDHGLAEYNQQIILQELSPDGPSSRNPGGPPCLEGDERVTATLRFTAYDRHGAIGGVEDAGICPDRFPHVVQSRALADLAAVLAAELTMARREGSIKLPEKVPYRDATFTLSNDPERLILGFKIRQGFSGTRSVSVYGDGRLELRHTGKGNVTLETFERVLEYPSMIELVRIAVDHGFAEWDRDGLHFYGIGAYSTHAQGAVGELHLETYQRGRYAREKLIRTFKFGDVRMSLEHSADVLQVQGLKNLLLAMEDYFESARGGVQP